MSDLHAVVGNSSATSSFRHNLLSCRFWETRKINSGSVLCQSQVMKARIPNFDVLNVLVFSSSAAVYGSPNNSPCTEDFPLTPNNPYGRTKLIAEEICRDIYRSDSEWRIILLRYFNLFGAHPSGYLGEDPRGILNNLMPFVQQVAVGRRPSVTIYGNNYAPKDGTTKSRVYEENVEQEGADV